MVCEGIVLVSRKSRNLQVVNISGYPYKLYLLYFIPQNIVSPFEEKADCG